jgi:ribulose 1,5-bisphosphate synthetase/thiazole synthase
MCLANLLFVSTIVLFLCSFSIAYDIIIYSATPGGIAAAITAARAAPTFKIAIIEPTAYIGGMAAAGGIGLRDLGLEDTSKFIVQISSFSID